MQNIKVDVSFVRTSLQDVFGLTGSGALSTKYLSDLIFGKWLLKLLNLEFPLALLLRAHYYPNFILAMDVYLAPIFFVGKRLFPEPAKSVV